MVYALPFKRSSKGGGVLFIAYSSALTAPRFFLRRVCINTFTAGNKLTMKNFCIAFLAVIIIVATVLFVGADSSRQESSNDYLRIHVRANSNSEEDQKVKYEVKDEVVAFITPYVKECVTKEAAMTVMEGLTDQIAQVCDSALKERGYDYGASASVRREEFPTRVYGDLTLENGVYDALIIELGTGKGDNWWCVIYPPLCFTSASSDVQYRSVIYDIINKFFNE